MKHWKKILVVCTAILGLGGLGAANAADDSTKAVADRSLKGDAVCTECHDENDNKAILAVYKGRHGVKADGRTPGCQSCHGASEAHVKNGPKAGEVGGKRGAVDVVFGAKSKLSAREQSEVCASCHKGGNRMHWTSSQHDNAGVSCVSCHTNHTHQDKVLKKVTQPEVCFTCHKTERAQTHRISTHPIDAGKMACSDCHNPHGSTGPKLLIKNSLNETCYTCHAEKRGPFLWEHGPVVDDCSNCHTPHGSTNAPLLKARAPWLCQECHSGDHGAQLNSGANLQGGNVTTVNGLNPLANAAARAQVAGRACLSCHPIVHGSNHPAGSKFQR